MTTNLGNQIRELGAVQVDMQHNFTKCIGAYCVIFSAIFMRKFNDKHLREEYTPFYELNLGNASDDVKETMNSIFHNFSFSRSIYFKKTGLSSRINPIVVKNRKKAQDDHHMLLEAFLASFIQSYDFLNSLHFLRPFLT